MSDFQVVVGNLGTVYCGDDREEAETNYWYYCKEVDEPHGRVSGESVTMISYGEVQFEKTGRPEEDWYDDSNDLSDIAECLSQITKEFWEAHRRKRPKAEIERIEAEVTRLSKMMRQFRKG